MRSIQIQESSIWPHRGVISNTVFSTTVNITTSSEPGTEATTIGISTTSNQTVAEVERED
ncbi:hypothetical protein BCV71DRAFT_226336, partial [Rhizopus microsporus]